MNGIDFLLDTNILIGLFSRHYPVLEYLEKKGVRKERCAISVISRLEILGYLGLQPGEERMLREKLARFRTLPLNDIVQETVIGLRQRVRLKLPDAIIAASSRCLIFLTRRLKPNATGIWLNMLAIFGFNHLVSFRDHDQTQE